MRGEDLAGGEARVFKAGATRQAFQPNSERCLAFAGPAGYPLCLTTLYEMLASSWH